MLEDTKYGDNLDDDGDSFDDDDEPVLVTCPYCREEMLEDSPRCPSCGKYISDEDAPPKSKPLWLLATIAICLIIALMWLVDLYASVRFCFETRSMNDAVEFLDRHGYASLPAIFTAGEIAALASELAMRLPVDDAAVRSGDAVYAARDLLRLCPAVIDWWRKPVLMEFVGAVLGDNAGLVRGLLFDKPPGQTWAVPWHKDRSIVIQPPGRLSDRYSPPRCKAGLWHCEPPETVLERMLSLRIHLDPSTAENGPLSVIAGSHRGGQRGDVVCLLAERGDVLAMRPLIDHASPRSEPWSILHRRVIHLEFAADPQLPDGYRWHEFHPVRTVTDIRTEAA